MIDSPLTVSSPAINWTALAPATQEELPVEVPLQAVVSFRVSGECFGLPLSCVREVTEVAALMWVPGAPPAIEGVMNLRGSVVPVVQLRTLLQLPTASEPSFDGSPIAPRLLLATPEGQPNSLWQIGLLSDGAPELIELPVENIRPPAQNTSAVQAGIVSGEVLHAGQVISLLDFPALLNALKRAAHV
jgi:purine-binding chemotaxis protein CheW